MASATSDDYLIVAAIDLGTTYSGYAYSTRKDFQRDPSQVFLHQWVDGLSNMLSNKTSSCILFDKNADFHSFGFEAEEKYLDLQMDEEENKWYFFRRIKMFLYKSWTNLKGSEIEDETGKSLPALKVFAESIKFLRDRLISECQKEIVNFHDEDIKWVLTVPAIWTDPAKSFMRMAAIEAGIESSSLKMALEPEAAAVFVKHLPLHRKRDGSLGDVFRTFKQGERYVVVDAGGGTVDITAHEILHDDKVKEILRPSGGSWGGTIVDDKYTSFITALVGKNTIKAFKTKNALGMYELCREFEITKRKISPYSDLKTTVRFPTALVDSYKEANTGKNVKSLSEIIWQKNKCAVSFVGDKLRIDSKTANIFFEESISHICQHLNTIFQSNEGRSISTILLVGGYAESAVLIDAIRSRFADKNVIIPKEAGWSVLAGAVIFGHDPSLIKQRKSKFTYGVACSQLFNPEIHDVNRKYIVDGVARCRNVFHKHVEIDEAIDVGNFQSDKIYGLSSSFNFTWEVYSSENEDPLYITEEGCKLIGILRLEKRTVDPDSKIRIQMSFSDTEIEVTMTYTKTGESTKIYLEQ